jgi:SAM-dependent methyltransferase
MTGTIDQKVTDYHPSLDHAGNLIGGLRDSRARLRLIEECVDFTGKHVCDLGCSGGFFAFEVARKAKSVTAVDANKELIEQNRRNARDLGYSNIEFIDELATPQFVSTLPRFDVVLFLSVFHHIIINSKLFPWSGSSDRKEALELIREINHRTDVLVFEMGETWESFTKWGSTLNATIDNTREWIPKHVFGTSYKSVTTLRGVGYQRLPFNWMPWLARPMLQTRFGRKLMKKGGFARRDFRDIYIGFQ